MDLKCRCDAIYLLHQLPYFPLWKTLPARKTKLLWIINLKINITNYPPPCPILLPLSIPLFLSICHWIKVIFSFSLALLSVCVSLTLNYKNLSLSVSILSVHLLCFKATFRSFSLSNRPFRSSLSLNHPLFPHLMHSLSLSLSYALFFFLSSCKMAWNLFKSSSSSGCVKWPCPISFPSNCEKCQGNQCDYPSLSLRQCDEMIMFSLFGHLRRWNFAQ